VIGCSILLDPIIFRLNLVRLVTSVRYYLQCFISKQREQGEVVSVMIVIGRPNYSFVVHRSHLIESFINGQSPEFRHK